MPLLHGIRLLLDDAALAALSPWLDQNERSDAPAVEVRFESAHARPRILRVVAREQGVWLGETDSGLILGDDDDSWFTIARGSPPSVRGALARAPRSGDGLEERKLFQGALLAALAHEHVYELHAGVVCSQERALVLLGDSGAGKSTTTTALVSAGCRYLGDDSLMLRQSEHGIELLSYSSSFRLTDHALESFPELRPLVHKDERDPKWQLDTTTAFPELYLSSWLGPISLIFLARVAEGPSQLAQVSTAYAIGALIAQSTALGLECHPTPKAHLALLASLATHADCKRLDLGTEWLKDPSGAAARLLAKLHGSVELASKVRGAKV